MRDDRRLTPCPDCGAERRWCRVTVDTCSTVCRVMPHPEFPAIPVPGAGCVNWTDKRSHYGSASPYVQRCTAPACGLVEVRESDHAAFVTFLPDPPASFDAANPQWMSMWADTSTSFAFEELQWTLWIAEPDLSTPAEAEEVWSDDPCGGFEELIFMSEFFFGDLLHRSTPTETVARRVKFAPA